MDANNDWHGGLLSTIVVTIIVVSLYLVTWLLRKIKTPRWIR